MSKLIWPKGATHVRIESPDGKHSNVPKEGAEAALTGVEGTITFLAKQGKSYLPFAGTMPNPYAKPEAPAPAEAPAPVTPAVVGGTTEDAAPAAPAAPVEPAQPAAPESPAEAKPEAPKAKAAEAPKAAKPAKGKKAPEKPAKAKPAKAVGAKKEPKYGKTRFISDKIVEGKLEARQIALEVLKKYPDPSLQTGKTMLTINNLGKEDPDGKHVVHKPEFEKALRFVRAVPYWMKKNNIKGHYAKASHKSKD